MNCAWFRFYAELNDFLPPARRGVTFAHAFQGGPSVKDAVESLGVPHTEVDLVLADGESVDFAWILRDGARVSVYPVFESIDIAPLARVRPTPLREVRFVLDVHLGRLARYLRMLGFDARWRPDARDDEIASIAAAEHRIVLTRDAGLLKRRIVTHGYRVRESDPERQLHEVVRRLDLLRATVPFRRCLRCNALLEVVRKEDVLDELPPRVRERHELFRRCPSCRRIYWAGSHHRRMERLISELAVPTDLTWLRGAVAALYDENRQVGVAPWCERAYDFVCPSVGTYPFQWFWDSCFHATVLRHLDVGRAETELVTLLANQEADGFVGHVTLWQREQYAHLLANYNIAYRTPHVSDCIQPPALAEAVWDVARAGRGTAFIREVVPKVRAFYDWLHRVRDPDRDGLIAVLLPDESGLDHTPKFDAYLGIAPGDETLATFDAAWARIARAYESVGRDSARMFALDLFVVEEVLLNSIYGRNLRFLARLLSEIGDQRAADDYDARAAQTTRSLLAKCYDAERGLFFDLAGRVERRLEVNTFTCLMPLLLPDLPADIARRLIAHLEDPDTYALACPVPSVARTEPTFRPGPVGTRLTWRGPTWLNVNWLCARGLRQHGRDDLAGHLGRRSVELVKRSGFREYYDPLTGEGHGARHFAWSGLVLDMVAARWP